MNQVICGERNGSLLRGPKRPPEGAQYTGDLRPVTGIVVNEPAATRAGPAISANARIRWVIGISRLFMPPERPVLTVQWTFSGLAEIAGAGLPGPTVHVMRRTPRSPAERKVRCSIHSK